MVVLVITVILLLILLYHTEHSEGWNDDIPLDDSAKATKQHRSLTSIYLCRYVPLIQINTYNSSDGVSLTRLGKVLCDSAIRSEAEECLLETKKSKDNQKQNLLKPKSKRKSKRSYNL